MVKKSLWPRVQRYFPKGSGIQQPVKMAGTIEFSKILIKKTLTVHPILAGGHCAPTIWVPMESLLKVGLNLGGVCKFWFPGEAERAVKVWEACQSGKLG